MGKWEEDPEERETDEGCWRRADDNRLPNPSINLMKTEEFDERDEAANQSNHDTKVIMAHEFREDPEMFKEVAQSVAESYNEQHCLKVGGELPAELRKEEGDG
jgi:hypothetical protein